MENSKQVQEINENIKKEEKELKNISPLKTQNSKGKT